MVKRRIFRILIALLCVVLIAGVAVLALDAWVLFTTRDKILTPEEAAKIQNADCILVLGCQVRNNGVPSAMLEDRLRRSVELYDLGAAPKLLMSGDHGRENYDEVGAMRQYAMDNGVPSEDIFMDHAGFSTYESMYRARDVFQAKKIIIVTQQYHLYRSIYAAEALGLEAYGVACDYRQYSGQLKRDVREVLARAKDVATGIFQPKPTYLGEAIPIWGDGNLTMG
jgi:vancomycin permeability regulator SanA